MERRYDEGRAECFRHVATAPVRGHYGDAFRRHVHVAHEQRQYRLADAAAAYHQHLGNMGRRAWTHSHPSSPRCLFKQLRGRNLNDIN